MAVKAVKKFAQQAMGTKKILIDAGLNAAIWDKGIKNVPHRIRVRLQRESPLPPLAMSFHFVEEELIVM